MGDDILFVVSYMGVSRLFSLHKDSSFEKFCSCVGSKFDGTVVEGTKFVCQVGELNGVIVDCPGDFHHLLSVYDIVSSKLVKVEIRSELNTIVGPKKCVSVVEKLTPVHLPYEIDSGMPNLVDVDELGDNTVIGPNRNVEVQPELILSSDEYLDSNNEFMDDGGKIGNDNDTGLFVVENLGVVGRCLNIEDNYVGLGMNMSRSSKQNAGGFVSDYFSSRKKNNAKDPHPASKASTELYRLCSELGSKQKKRVMLSDEWSNVFEAGLGGQWFGGAAEFRADLIKYSTQLGFKFRYVRNTDRYVHDVCHQCSLSGCEWFIKAKSHIGLSCFVIHKANFVHKCLGKLFKNDGKRMSPKVISDLVMESVKNKLETSGKDIMKMMKRTVDAARSRIFGSFADSYDQLNWYCRSIVKTNSGSIVALEINSATNKFERVFIAFNACLQGFRYCRPLLFIDGTFMKGRARGTLLVATAKDADNGLFPVPFAVVSAENTSNWEWFLCKLRDCISHPKEVSFMSDRNTGLVAVFPKVFGYVNHYYCTVHLIANLKLCLKKGWNNILRARMGENFKACAYAPTRSIFDEKLKVFKFEGGKRAEDWISQIPLEKWAVCHSPEITRYGEMTSNAVESFNSWISKERELPITHMIDSIRLGINKWHVERRAACNLWNDAIVPSKEVVWAHLSNMGRSWYVIEASSGSYEVRSTPSAMVNLVNKTCTCFQWQLTGFPCAHAVASIRRGSNNITDFVDPFFLCSSYRESYAFDMHPIPETEMFQNCLGFDSSSKILPPVLKRPPGCPKKERITPFGVVKKVKLAVCERCGKLSKHDPWTCGAGKSSSST